ncbi:MAG: hypothetical protein JWN44_2 [Myxococcales bacterium]|nr:hypothetical protein [Myxococcales bacterium]
MDKIIDRLKQRKLVQWAFAYVAAAFALIQVLDIVGQRFGWPEQVVRVLIITLAVGFFVTLVLAWYHGERGAQRVTATELIILVLLLAAGGGVLVLFGRGPHKPAAVATAADAARAPAKSIAVLPFTDLSPAHDQEYFSDGMAEEILNALAKVKTLKVAGRTSSFSFKGKNYDLRLIGKALAVANVLEGSVRKQGNKVRITAQLIQAEDGYHLWSESYDGELSDVFELQERIARAIADQLKALLHDDQQQRLVPIATNNPEAYALYLQATGIFNRREGPRLPEAIAELEHALALDPRFARAHSRLAAIHLLQPIYVPDSADKELSAAEHEAGLAIELDPTLAEPHSVLAMVYGQRGHYTDSLAAMDRALAIDPDDMTAGFWAGVAFVNTGYIKRGCARFDHVLSIDPLMPNALLWRGIQYAYAGDLDRAEVLMRRAADVGLLHVGIGMHPILAARGQRTEAAKQLANGLRALGAGLAADAPDVLAAGVYGDAAAHARALAEIDAYMTTNPERVAGVVPYSLLLLGENRRALAVISRKASSNDALCFHLLWSPAGRSIRLMPEFAAFVKKSGLAELWDKYGAPDVCRRQSPGNYVCD